MLLSPDPSYFCKHILQFIMKLIGPILAFALVALASAQKPSLTVSVKEGEMVTGEKKFTVKVVAKHPVTQVEFYVGSELRDSDASTPYEFTLDSLGESDGDLKLKFAAYTAEGENITKTITVKIDNGSSKGLEFHLNHAKEMLAVSKWDAAITSGRVALKADPKSKQARLYLARAYMGKGVYDKAQKFAEDAAADDPNNLDALELLSAINLNRAFNTLNRSGERSDTMKQIADALKGAVTARRKSLDHQIDTFGAISDSNRMAYVDLAMRGGRYSLAIEQLNPLFRADVKNADVGNRLAYAYLRAGRLTEAREVLDNIKRFGSADAYTSALDASYWIQTGQDQKADEAIREALLNDPDSLGVKSAQAFIALKRNRSAVLAQLARDLASSESQRTEVNYYVAALYNRMSNPDARKFYPRAVLIEPTNYDMYIEWGNYALGLGVSGRIDKKDADAEVQYAQALFEAALAANPSSSQALTGLSLVSLYQNKLDDAVRFGKAAAAAAPQYAAAHYAYSAAASAKATSLRIAGQSNIAMKTQLDELSKIATQENLMAGKLDPIALEGRELPKVSQAWNYFSTGGRTVVLVPPGK